MINISLPTLSSRKASKNPGFPGVEDDYPGSILKPHNGSLINRSRDRLLIFRDDGVGGNSNKIDPDSASCTMKPRLARNDETVAPSESLTQCLSNKLGLLFSLLLHGVGLVWFLSEHPATHGEAAPFLIEVSFVRGLPEIPSPLSPPKSSERIEEDYPRSTPTPHHGSRTSVSPPEQSLDSTSLRDDKVASKPTKKDHHTSPNSASPHHHSEHVWLAPPSGSESLKKAVTHPQGTRRDKVSPRYHAGSRQNPLPTYPYVSRRRGEEGKVTCAVTVTPDGTPKAVEIKESSGYARLDDAAKNVLSTWVFDPLEENSQKIYGFVQVSITFHLTEGVKI